MTAHLLEGKAEGGSPDIPFPATGPPFAALPGPADCAMVEEPSTIIVSEGMPPKSKSSVASLLMLLLQSIS